MKIRTISCIVGAIAVAATALVICMRSDVADETVGTETGARRGMLRKGTASKYAGKTAEEAVRSAVAGQKARKGAQKRKLKGPKDLFAHLKGKDRTLAENLQRALDDDDHGGVFKAAVKSLKSDNPEVRQDAVEALSWLGADALPELTGAMADPNEDVATAAANHWENAVSEIEDASERIAILSAAMFTIADPEQLTMVGSLFSGAALELIDGVEDSVQGVANRVEIIQALAETIEGGNSVNAEAAKEMYSDITGNDWAGSDEAELYLANPDGYEAPDDRDADYDYNYVDPAVEQYLKSNNGQGANDNEEVERD